MGRETHEEFSIWMCKISWAAVASMISYDMIRYDMIRYDMIYAGALKKMEG